MPLTAKSSDCSLKLFSAVFFLVLLRPVTGVTQDYRVGELRDAQQGNFCTNSEHVDEIILLFEKFGAPTGYSALSASRHCRLEVHSFMPKALYRSVTIALSDGGQYIVRFIHVELAGGDNRLLVTTRDLLQEEP